MRHGRMSVGAGKGSSLSKMVQVEEGEEVTQWNDFGAFQSVVAIQESGTWGDVRAYVWNLVFS